MEDIVANASVATAGSTYTVPKNGLCTISYVVDFNNEVSSEHNANSANYTLYVNNVAVKSDSRNLSSSTGGTTFTGTWSGNVNRGQSIRINTSSGGWIKLNVVSMTIIIL